MSLSPAAVLAASLVVLSAGCSADDGTDATPVHVTGASVSSSDPSDPSTESPGSPRVSTSPVSLPAPTSGSIRVSMLLQVPASDATRVFSAYVDEHARSVIAGEPSPGLRDVTSASEYARQTQVVGDARDRGLTVPSRPRVAVVSSREVGAGHVDLGVCLWLPSTEFVDEITGVSPAGPVPEQWAPAVAQVSRATMTWVVDKLGQPATKYAPDCRGLS